LEISLHGKTVLSSHLSAATNGLWQIDLNTKTHPALALGPAMHPINHPTMAQIMVAFAHAVLFSPALSTLQKALKNNYIHIPGLMLASLKCHPPQLTTTIKGHLNQQWKNLVPTSVNPDKIPQHKPN
jgi:hypothetical protein